MVLKKNSHHLAEEMGIGVVLASLTMLIAAPWLVYAMDGTDGDISQVISQVARTVADIQGQITGLGSKVDGMSSKLDSLSSRVESMALADKSTNVTAPGIAECLATCRKTATICLNARPAIAPTTGAAPTIAPQANLTASRSACMTQSTSCIRNCRPQTTDVTCDTSCAVQLGICIRGSGGDVTTVKACRKANETCLITTCTPQTLTVGTLRAGISIVLPAGTCQSQCSLEQAVCRQAARFDQAALDECSQIYKSCSQVVCSDTASETAPKVKAPTGQATPKNIICENACTDSYYKCRQTAGSDQTALASCSNTYGTCRNQCLIQSGGGFGTEN